MSRHRSISVFAPATVANVACGFDVFGFALDQPGDIVTATPGDAPGVRIESIEGDDGRLPTDPDRNTAAVAATALLARHGDTRGVALRLRKGIPLAGGLGGSAASAVAAAVAVDQLFGLESDPNDLLRAALEGERAATGSPHADNAAACLHGGFVLVRAAGSAPSVTPLPVPAGLAAAILHPHVEVPTGAARAALGDRVPLARAVTQWGNTAALVAGLFREDWDLIGDALHDAIAEPARAGAVPGFAAVQKAAHDAGALGCSLSGSGPSLFALCRDAAAAETVRTRMVEAYRRAVGPDFDHFVSPVAPTGARVTPPGPPAGER